jgi:hypothetical protein
LTAFAANLFVDAVAAIDPHQGRGFDAEVARLKAFGARLRVS